ncbi:MAG: hypothetical protein K6E35_02255 [Bacteroidales bacterium]|nr:hypothetical protein [Bacteroidales bacterium]
MKKYLLSIAALLLGLLAHSQEADDLGNYAEVSIIPRLDVVSVFGNDPEFNLGNSSLYTLFEGSASEHFSWTVSAHLLGSSSFKDFFEESADLYRNLGYSWESTALDLAYVDLTFGSWTFNLGKNCIATGGHEYDDYDWMVHPQLASPLWNDLCCYQWGGKVSYTTPSELSSFSLQMTTSPFGEHPFGSGLWTYSAQWSGEYDWYSPLWSASALGTAPGEYAWLFSLGNQFSFGDWTVTLDWTNTAGMNENYDDFMKGSTFHGRVGYTPSERWDVSLRGNYIITPQDIAQRNWWNLGAVAEFYPLQDSQDLRIHAIAAYDSLLGGFQLCAGVLYNLSFKLW